MSFKFGDRVWYKEPFWMGDTGLRRATVIGFDTRWGFAVTVRLDGTTGSVTTSPVSLAPMNALDLIAEKI